MRIPKQAFLRLALAGWLGLAGSVAWSAAAAAAEAPEKIFPDSAVFFLKVNNAAGLREAFRQSQMGQLWMDPALKPFKDDAAAKMQDASKSLKETVGVSLAELLELPQGPAALAVMGRDDDKNPVAAVLIADAGKNADKMADVLTKATARGEGEGAKVTTEDFKGLALHVIQAPRGKDAEKDPSPAIWTQDGPTFYFSSSVDALKDVLANSAGRENALASNENFEAVSKKLGADAQGFWFADLTKLLSLASKIGSQGQNADTFRQVETFVQILGINGMKAAGGTMTLNTGAFDSVSKTFVLAPAPLQGLLKIFAMPKVSLKPEPWVPATVATYQSWSWDLDAAFTAINDLANMFQPGVLNVLEQQLIGPNGGEPLNFKKDVFDPLGDRVTVISDFKKPVTEDSQRMLFAIALEDQKGFEATLGKIIALVGANPKKREFQGVTIHDFDLPEIPNAGAGNVQFKGPVSLAIAKNTLFVSTEQTLLEQAIRGDGPSLAESALYQSVAKEIPPMVSGTSYVRPDESARVTYDMIKSGQFERALAQGAAAGAGAPDFSKLGKIFDKDKLPEFSVFSKYLSQGGGYTVLEDDGLMISNFTLRKSTP